MPHGVTIEGHTIRTPRLTIRPWAREDASGALATYGDSSVAKWLAPAMVRVEDVDEMARVIETWIAGADPRTGRPNGRWAIDERATGELAGASQILGLPPELDDLAIGYQLAPAFWGRGLGTEAAHALAHFAFDQGEEEVFAVARPTNSRGIATALRIGMEWVGETDKYYDMRLQVFRLRKGDLDHSALRP